MSLRSAWLATALVAAVGVAGCVQGPNPAAPRPDPRQFVLGQTTEAEVIARLGEPQRRSEQLAEVAATKDHVARRMMTASLAYGTRRDGVRVLDPGVTFQFRDGKLSGYQTGLSSRPGFGNFDFNKVRDLLANKATTRFDVVGWLGDPSSRTLIERNNNGSSAERDIYVFNRASSEAGEERSTKVVFVTYDDTGHVVSYSLSEQRR